MPQLALSFLGSFQAALDGQPVTGFESNKVRALLAYLAVEAAAPHSREALIGLLWPDRPEATARSNLSQALANLRRVTGDQAAQPPFLLITPATLQFNPAADHRLDLAGFTGLLAACAQHRHRRQATCHACLRRMAEAAALYRGDFLAGFSVGGCEAFETWVGLQRERLRQQALGTLFGLAAHAGQVGQPARMLQYARRQLEIDPAREEAHRQAMHALALSGERSAALEQFERCRQALEAELSVTPERATTELYEQIRAGLLGAQPPALTSQRLPQPPTPLVGRTAELAALGDWVENPNCRLITIAGPGGIGKTRLAVALAAEYADGFTHGARFISLAALSSAEFLPVTLLAALGHPVASSAAPVAQLLDRLHDQEILLVLDNFEQLLDGAALLAQLLAHAPGVVLVVTSRERLALQAEWLFDLDGLTYPDTPDPAGLGEYSAVQLFTQRAAQVHRTAPLAASEAPAIVRICQLVQGLPLAVELAAAATRERSCAVVAAELEMGLRQLSAAWRDVPPRHRSMQAVFDQSWGQLSAAEQRAFRRLGVFRGGFEPEAAEQVAGAGGPLLSALVDKSLVRRTPTGRCSLHELARQYALAQLGQAGEAPATWQRMVTYYLALIAQAEPELIDDAQPAWLDRLALEHNNVRAALEWCRANGEAEAGLWLAGMLRQFWEARGALAEGLVWLEAALAQDQSPAGQRTVTWQPPPRRSWAMAATARAHALITQANLLRRKGDLAGGIEAAEAALALCRANGDRWGLAGALNILGRCRRDRHEFAPAQPILEESLALYRSLGHSHSVAMGIGSLGILAAAQGDVVRATALCQESLALCRQQNNRWGAALQLEILGSIALSRDDFAQAVELFEESAGLFKETGFKIGWARSLGNAGHAQRQLGDYARARATFETCLALEQELGNADAATNIRAILAELDLALAAAPP